MSNTDSAAAEALAALGMTADAAASANTAPATEAPAETAPAAEASEGSEEAAFEVGEVSDLTFDDVPALERTFSARKSRYGFEDIKAPGEDGQKYHGKLVPFSGGDKDKFKRSVQSAANGQNRSSKAADAPNYYVTRTAEKEGNFVGMYIIRTDARPAATEEAATE